MQKLDEGAREEDTRWKTMHSISEITVLLSNVTRQTRGQKHTNDAAREDELV